MERIIESIVFVLWLIPSGVVILFSIYLFLQFIKQDKKNNTWWAFLFFFAAIFLFVAGLIGELCAISGNPIAVIYLIFNWFTLLIWLLTIVISCVVVLIVGLVRYCFKKLRRAIRRSEGISEDENESITKNN